MRKAFGWLFGLECTSGHEVLTKAVSVRLMTAVESDRIVRASRDFFAKDITIWHNTIERFPYVYEKEVNAGFPVGGNDSIAVLLSLLGPGEVRSPIQWVQGETGGGSSSSSDVIDYFYRFINGRFQPIDLNLIAPSLSTAIGKLEEFLKRSPHDFLGTVLIDRLYASKEHVIGDSSPKTNTVSRAADVCIALEYLLGQGVSSEVQFRLAMSLAWLLEATPELREKVFDSVRLAYALRSKTVHGARVDANRLSEKDVKAVLEADRLLRRLILTKLMSRLDESEWSATIKRTQFGHTVKIDRGEWITV
ncbi:MAG: hypothetical protein L0387_00925 [Acidobacteria bacterium]|nr:hypothetical protein [Acidobacteriota bacterium]